MGYYISTLKKGKKYELDGKTIEFIQKLHDLYYFYICEMDEWEFDFKPTPSIVFYTSKEIEYIKRVQDGSARSNLRCVGKDKVFPRN